MKGFPKVIQTRQDMERLLAAYPEQAKAYLRRLLDERMHVNEGQWAENPNSALAGMGISTVEAVAWVGGDYTDPPAPDMTPDMPALIAAARRGWELRCQQFVQKSQDGSGDRYAPHHDTAMIEVTLQVMATPEEDRTIEMLTRLDRVNQARGWKLQVNAQYMTTAAAIGQAEAPEGIRAALEAGELALTALDAADPGVSLADLYPQQPQQ